MILGQGARTPAENITEGVDLRPQYGIITPNHQYPTVVFRTPHASVYEPEAGADYWSDYNTRQQFDYNGHLVPQARPYMQNPWGTLRGGGFGDFGAPILTTRGSAAAKWNSVLTDTNNLNALVTSWYHGGKLNPTQLTWVNSWVSWRDSTYAQYKEVSTLGTEWANTVWDRGDAKLAELAQWRAQFQQLSGMVPAPGSRPGADNPNGLDWTTAVKYAAVAAGIGAAAWVATSVISRIPRARAA